MLPGVLDLAEMRQEKPFGRERGELVQTREGVLEVELRRSRSHREIGTVAEPGSGGISGEDRALDREGMVVEGMTGCIVRGEAEAGEFDRLPVGDCLHPIRRRRGESTPKTVKTIPVDAAGTLEQPPWIHEMPGTAAMHPDINPAGRKPTGRSGVIQMNVGDQHATKILR